MLSTTTFEEAETCGKLMSMHYSERVYGPFEIDDPVLIELIASPDLKRLKRIDQAGYLSNSFLVFLIRGLNIRWVSVFFCAHTALLLPSKSQVSFTMCHIRRFLTALTMYSMKYHQDNMTEEYVRRSSISSILEKHGFAVDDILDDRNFSLKEKLLPDLCADRIDYSLRAARVMNEVSSEYVNSILAGLTAKEGNWVFTDVPTARKFAEVFKKMNETYYAGIESAVMFQMVSDYLRHALQMEYISINDIYGTDAEVLAKINPHHAADLILQEYFDRMNKRIPYLNDPDQFVDPLLIHEKRIKRLSRIMQDWKAIVKTESAPKTYFLRFGKDVTRVVNT